MPFNTLLKSNFSIWCFRMQVCATPTHLVAGLALALLVPPVHPVVVGGRLFPVLAGAHIPEARLARELHVLHEAADAMGVRDDLARAALEPSAIFLQQTRGEVNRMRRKRLQFYKRCQQNAENQVAILQEKSTECGEKGCNSTREVNRKKKEKGCNSTRDWIGHRKPMHFFQMKLTWRRGNAKGKFFF